MPSIPSIFRRVIRRYIDSDEGKEQVADAAPVQSVNQQDGNVSLDHTDVGAIAFDNIENDDVQIATDSDGNLVIEHKPTGGTLVYNSAENQWEPSDSLKVDSLDNGVAGDGNSINRLVGAVISTETPDIEPDGTQWLRLDDSGSEIWTHNLHSGGVWSVFERNGVIYSGSSDDSVVAAVSDPTTWISNGDEWLFQTRLVSDREGGQLG